MTVSVTASFAATESRSRLDVTDSAQVKAMVDAACAEFGRLDILHNNVGIAEVGGPVDASEESWDRVHDVNLKSAF
ncbi:MAG: SDR family oxidoreductase, partial [Gemmatimonadales bacterium]|nr:SDR family oxidoreductase [Gemmatimonadales bacterium]